LIGGNGKSFSSQALVGKPYAIYFGFTRCGDVCPTTLSRLVKLRRQAANDQAMNIVFVTIDPGHDGAKEVGQYANLFNAPIIGLTGRQAQIDQVKKQYGIFAEPSPHPMAGKESSGFLAGGPQLFDGCAWVLCLEPGDTDLTDWLTLAGLCTSLGARVVPVTAAEHDRAVAQISHVPHLLAAALSGVLAGNPLAGTLAAGSFRDGTRVAGSRPELIAAMCGGNAAAVRQVLAVRAGGKRYVCAGVGRTIMPSRSPAEIIGSRVLGSPMVATVTVPPRCCATAGCGSAHISVTRAAPGL